MKRMNNRIFGDIRYHSENLFIFRDEAPDRSVVSSLPFRREETTRELLHFPVIGNTFTAPSLPFTGFVGAVAPGFVLFDIAFEHQSQSLLFKSQLGGFEGSSEKMIPQMIVLIFFYSTPWSLDSSNPLTFLSRQQPEVETSIRDGRSGRILFPLSASVS